MDGAVNSETVVFEPAATPENVAPEVEVTATETPQETQEPETPKTFTQEDVDRIAQKERERAERRALRKVGDEVRTLREKLEQITQPQQQPEATGDSKPQKGDFDSYEAYIEALGTWSADQRLAKERQETQKRDQQTAQERSQKEFQKVATTRVEAGRKEYADFDEVINEAAADGTLPIGSPLHIAIIESDIGHKVAYHLAKNPDEAERLAGLPPLSMAREIGKLEARLSTAPAKQPKPAPIEPVGSGGSATSGLRDDDDMDTWIKKRNAQIRKR